MCILMFNQILLEISSLGFAGKTIKTFEQFLGELHLDGEGITSKSQEQAIRTSYYIYCRGSKKWMDLDLMTDM